MPRWSHTLIQLCLLPGLIVSNTLIASSQAPQPSAQKSTEQSPQQLQHIVLGSGCFWGAEKRYAALPGVVDAVSGYSGGQGVPANYQAISARGNKDNPNNHIEVVRVSYNPSLLTTEQLLKNFYESHDPTQGNRQGNDHGTQYRSVIFYENEQQHQQALSVTAQYQQRLTSAGFGAITTVIRPLQAFYRAEEYHQDYLAKNPNGYCPDHSTGVRFADSPALARVDNHALLRGKQLMILEADGCPYCEKLKENVLNDYQGDVTLHFRQAGQLQGLQLTTEAVATPTLYFLEDGKERFAIQGYVAKPEFYKALGYFKLGDSEAFRVAFAKGTDGRFCKQYELFKNTGDGTFIDKLSGVALFDTQYRFNSGSGWLSFTQAIAGSVLETPDNSYGMQRIEVRSASSGIHLGHVFNDGPNGQRRFCINATVLDFKPRSNAAAQ